MWACSFRECPDPFRSRHLGTLENRKYSTNDKSANRKTGLLERQIQTWQNTGERFQDLIVERIRATLEAKIAQERGKRAERTAGYSNDDNALRREFGIDLEPEASQAAQGSSADPGEDLRGLVEAAVFGELADA